MLSILTKPDEMNFKTTTTFLLYSLLILSWIPALSLDSTRITYDFFDDKVATSFIIIGLWVLLFSQVDNRLKVFMLIMVPLSWLGEVICCLWLNMYNYRQSGIPIYVPFGHAVIYISGYLLTNLAIVKRNEQKIKKALIISFIALFLVVFIIYHDTLSAGFAILFFYALHRKNYPIFYLIMSVLVLYLELVGTQLGTWQWHTNWWIFTTINPPVGAIFIYIAGDMMLNKLVNLSWIKKRQIST